MIENWGQDGSEPLFAYRIKCKLWRGDCMAGEGLGYASSRESKHRYRWVDEDTARRMGLDVSKLPSHDGRKRMFEFDFAIEKAEITGQYGKPESYWSEFRNAIAQGRAKRVQRETKSGTRNGWEIDIGQLQYRIPNPDIADVINTVLKMAMKRALIAAVIVTVNVSDRFTQDLEDFIDVDYVDATPVNCNAAQAQGSAAPAQPIVTAPVNGTSSKFEAQEQKPWSTRGEMAAKFCEMRQRYSALNFSGVYESTLRQFGVASAEKFTDATKALDCYRALVAGLEGR